MSKGGDSGDPDRTQELVQAARDGDGDAAGALVQRYLPALRQFIRLRSDPILRQQESVSDLVQTACREVLGQLDKFEYRGEQSFRNWLFSCALNSVRSKRRAHLAEKRGARRRDPHGDEKLAQQYATLGTPSVLAAAREQIEALEAAFDRLPEDHREVILLARLQGLPHKEVASRMGRSEEAVRQLLKRALVRLSKLVADA